MLHTPRPPHVFTTFQVECVVCKHSFLVAEADPRPRRGHDQWRIVSSNQPYVNLRYMADRTRQPTQPPPRPHTQQKIPPPSSPHFGDNALNCPRCGADNRNWLHVLHGHADGRSLPGWPWLRKFPFAAAGVGIALLLTFIVLIRSWNDYERGSLAILAFAVFLAGMLPCYFAPKAWAALREYKNGRGYLPTRILLSPPLRHILIIGVVFIFILPGFLYVAKPLGFNFLESLLSSEAPPLPQIDTAFLNTWFKYTLASHVLASIFALLAVSQYVGEISRQLPRPIFHSISDMVRVVQWEAKRALEVDGDMRHVQWIDVERNEIGGIYLIGLYRASPEFEEGRPVGATVRAQRYEIMSDAWGRLVYAEVRDVRVPISAVSPEHAMAVEGWPAPQVQRREAGIRPS